MLQIKKDDCLPKQLCPNCYIQLLKLNQFRELIIQSDTHLNKKPIIIDEISIHTDQVNLNQDTENCDDFTQRKTEIFVKEESLNNSDYTKKTIDEMVINNLSEFKNISLKPGRKPSNCKQKRKVRPSYNAFRN